MPINLNEKVCIVTGAGAGIGQAIANGFAARGALVVATDIEAPQAPLNGLGLAWDVADSARAESVMEEVAARFGRIDALVANAGIYPHHNWESLTPADWHKVLSINLDGAWFGAQAAARRMAAQGYGKIVLTSSIEVQMGVAVHCHYDSAKAGLIGLTRSMARAVGTQGVRVNCVMPGAILTDTEIAMFPDREGTDRLVNERQCVPGRITPESIEPVYAWLCAAESDIITGQVVCADQGFVHY